MTPIVFHIIHSSFRTLKFNITNPSGNFKMVLFTKALGFLASIATVTATYEPKINNSTCLDRCISFGAEVGDRRCASEHGKNTLLLHHVLVRCADVVSGNGHPVFVHTCMPNGCWVLLETCDYGCKFQL
jgi:hypothetical protein